MQYSYSSFFRKRVQRETLSLLPGVGVTYDYEIVTPYHDVLIAVTPSLFEKVLDNLN